MARLEQTLGHGVTHASHADPADLFAFCHVNLL
jgi:hypothetical protein